MFEQTFVVSIAARRKPWTVTLSFLGQLVLFGIVFLIPLIWTDTLPRAQLTSFLVAPPPPPPPPPPAETPKRPKPEVIRKFDPCSLGGKLCAPKQIPNEISNTKDEKEEDLHPQGDGGVVGGVPGGPAAGGPSLVFPTPAAPPPPVKEKPKEATPSRIRVGGNVIAANLIRKITPVYPQMAKQARIQGVVRFTAIIGKDGTIQNLQLITGHPLLIEAARQAVQQWQYKPTQLNGEPVEVVTQIDVNFSLSQ